MGKSREPLKIAEENGSMPRDLTEKNISLLAARRHRGDWRGGEGVMTAVREET